MGVARPQNKNSEILNDVRNAGGTYHDKGGRGYNTNASLDFHIDFGDVVALLCRRDRTSVVSGKSVSVSVDHGGRRIIHKKTKSNDHEELRHPESKKEGK